MKSIIQQLKAHHKTISFAESMTGGALAASLTKMSGASQVFKGSIVCYDSSVKVDILKVSQAVIDTYGVVSQEVALAMAESCQHMFLSSIAVSVTGYAEGTEKDIFICIKDETTTIYHLIRNHQSRQEMIEEVVSFVFEKISQRLLFE